MTLGSSSDSHINTENLLNEQPCIFKSGCKSIKNKPSPFLRKKIPLLLTAIPRVTVSATFLTWHNSNKQLLFQLLLLLQFSLNHCCTTLSIYLCCLLYHLCRSSLFWKSHQDFKLYSRFWVGKAIVKYWVWLVTLFGMILTLCAHAQWARVNDKGPKGTISSLSILKLLCKTVFTDQTCPMQLCDIVVPHFHWTHQFSPGLKLPLLTSFVPVLLKNCSPLA